ncbi:hypothetical protein A9Q89_09595 [Gammaproteobacteria bacterium 53_120_T64]|nr:hypothetical protein A9Q89_09595 [Gammaproteobacteria bacterium 53_120_T64]
MKAGKSVFYAWKARPTPLITAQEQQIYRRTRVLFDATRYKAMKVMATLKLQGQQRVACKVTTKRQHSDAVAANLLNQNFNL